jgi:hypothetical protein
VDDNVPPAASSLSETISKENGPRTEPLPPWYRRHANLISLVCLAIALAVNATKDIASYGLSTQLDKLKDAYRECAGTLAAWDLQRNIDNVRSDLFDLTRKVDPQTSVSENTYIHSEIEYSDATLEYGIVTRFASSLSPLPEPLNSKNEALKKRFFDLEAARDPVRNSYFVQSESWKS